MELQAVIFEFSWARFTWAKGVGSFVQQENTLKPLKSLSFSGVHCFALSALLRALFRLRALIGVSLLGSDGLGLNAFGGSD